MRYSGDLRDAGRLGCLRREICAPPLQRGLVREAALAEKGVFERDERQEANTDEDGKEPECCAPAERLGEHTTQEWPEGWSEQGRTASQMSELLNWPWVMTVHMPIVDAHHRPALLGLVDVG